MPRKRNWPLLALGALLLLFGLGCLNYTEANGLEHHREAAERFGLPPPSNGIFLVAWRRPFWAPARSASGWAECAARTTDTRGFLPCHTPAVRS